MADQSLIVVILFVIVLIPSLVYILKRLIPKLPFSSYEWFMAKTYFSSNKHDGFISLISNISIIGMVLGTASIIIASSFMDGMRLEITGRLMNVDSHLKVSGFFEKPIKNFKAIQDTIASLPEVKFVSPKVMNVGLAKVRGTNMNAKPMYINGIDASNEELVHELSERIEFGKFNIHNKEILNPRRNKYQSYPGIVLGKYLADDMGLSVLDTGKIIIVSALPKEIEMNLTPTMQPFYFSGIIDLGFPEYDMLYAYTNLKTSQYLFQMNGDVSFLDIKLHNEKHVDFMQEKIDKLIEYPYKASTWNEARNSVFSLIEFEKRIYIIALSLICFLAGFNILSTLYMLVKDKTKEIGVLRSLGVTPQGVMKIFVYQGTIIGVIGAVAGVTLGLALVTIQDWYKVITFPRGTMILDYLPVDIQFGYIPMLMLFTILVSLLAGIYPAYKASRLAPVEAFRYE